MLKHLALAALLCAGAANAAGTWEQTLQARDIDGDGTTDAYYDTVLGITWMRDGDLGWRSWEELADLNGWRVPTGTDGRRAESPNLGEINHMFYVTLGNREFHNSGSDQEWMGMLVEPGPFLNLKQEPYWAGGPSAFGFNLFFGAPLEGVTPPEGELRHLWVVRDGDVHAIPEPEVWALMVAGLALVGWRQGAAPKPRPARHHVSICRPTRRVS